MELKKEQTNGKELVRNMEYLLKLLHREWERPGRTKVHLFLSQENAREVITRLTAVIADRQRQMEQEEPTFRQSLTYSRENFVLLRVVKKVKRAWDKAKRRSKIEFLSLEIELDREEYQLFSSLIPTEQES